MEWVVEKTTGNARDRSPELKPSKEAAIRVRE
jgi:hypothetical protein